MTEMHTEVISAALSLPPAVRAELAEELLNSLEDGEQLAIDAAWADEAERRIDQLDQGGTTLLPGQDVIAKLRNRSR
jgi:putative addiction module component (TIGR02574 family)